MVTRSVSSLAPGTSLSRYLVAIGKSMGDPTEAAAFAERWADTPQVKAAFETQMHTKAAVAAGSTIDAAWAGALQPSGIAQEALTLLRDLSVFGAAESRMRKIPFNAPVPRQTGTGSGGGRILEGSAVPTIAFAFDVVQLAPEKVATLTVVSKELLRAGDPSAERTIRAVVLGALAQVQDRLFLLPSEVGAITYGAGATAVTSTGSSAAQITTDLQSMIDAITSSGRGLTWILPPTTLATIALKLGAASGDVPRTLLGLPVIVSANSPAQIVLADLAEVVYADDGGFAIDLSRASSIQMDSAPTMQSVSASSPAEVTGTTTTSLFQSNSVAFRAVRWISWERVRDGAVAVMSVSY